MRPADIAHLKKVLEYYWNPEAAKRDALPDPSIGQENAIAVIIQCIDSRVCLSDFASEEVGNVPKGVYFSRRAAGAAIPPFDPPSDQEAHSDQRGSMLSTQTAIDIGFALTNFKHVKTLIVAGHTGCGANAALMGALASDIPQCSDATRWMFSALAMDLKEAVQTAYRHNANEGNVARLVEKVTTLEAARNALGYVFTVDRNDAETDDYYIKRVSMESLINDGGVHIIPMIQVLGPERGGRGYLQVFDPETGGFYPLENEQSFDQLPSSHKEMSAAHIAKSPYELLKESLDSAIKNYVEQIKTMPPLPLQAEVSAEKVLLSRVGDLKEAPTSSLGL